MFVRNIVNLSAAVHELSRPQAALLYLTMVKKNRKSGTVALTFDLWPWNSIAFVRLSRYMFVQNFIELSAAVR